VIGFDAYLEKSSAKFRVPVMAFAVGVYLPFDLSSPILLGGVIAYLVTRALDKQRASAERRGEVDRNGLLAAAGFITGEALMGIGLAIPVALFHDADVLALPIPVPELAQYAIALGLVGVTLVLLYKLAFRRTTAPPA